MRDSPRGRAMADQPPIRNHCPARGHEARNGGARHEEPGGNGQLVLKGVVTVDEALRYAMSLPVATIISGIDSLAVLRQNLAIARGFQPMPAAEMEALRGRCAAAAGDGHLELYKSTMKY